MKARHSVLGVAISTLLATSALASGCFDNVSNCNKTFSCEPEGSGGGGGGIAPSSGCIPSESTNPVGDACGVFVSSSKGDDGNGGTKAAPLKTLAKGLDLAVKAGKPLYACAEAFEEAITVPAGMVLFGGLDCSAMWGFIGTTTQTQVAGKTAEIPVRLTSGSGTTQLYDLHVKAASASKLGDSSVAVIAEAAKAVLQRCTLEAGYGMAGMDGVTPSGTGAQGEDGLAGGMACTDTTVAGGVGPQNVCDSVVTFGGPGGDGKNTGSGDNGGSGGPLDENGIPAPPGVENNGKGDTGGGCSQGKSGTPGTKGLDASNASGLGDISASGYAGVSGSAGKAGEPGQGGGGGGGAKGGSSVNQCTLMTSSGGASGGGGGAGGCGGAGGMGGGPGGSSIALVSLSADVKLTTVKLVTGKGGSGGMGGAGQEGGAGGGGGKGGTTDGKSALKDGCAGGAGGPGGFGGKGGKGLDGHSLGIAFKGILPAMDAVTFEAKGVAGGPSGVKADTQEFP